MWVLFRAVFVSRIGAITVSGLYHPIFGVVIKGIPILVVDVLAVALMDLTGFLHLTTGLVTSHPLLDFGGLLLEFGLGLTMGSLGFGGLPPFDFGHERNS